MEKKRWKDLLGNLNSWPNGTVSTVAVSPSAATVDNDAVSSLMFTSAPELALLELAVPAGEASPPLPPPPLLFDENLGIHYYYSDR
jgi:hypothetical protein